MIDLESVAHGLLRDVKGGARTVAALCDMNPTVLCHKTNPNMPTHHLSANESLSIQMVTGDHRILMAEAEALGYTVVRIPDVDAADFATEAMRTVKEFGEFIGKCGEVMEDGKVSSNELAEVVRELLEAQAHITRLHQIIASKAANR